MDPKDRDTLPPPGWKPKSAFFKAIWAEAEFRAENKRLTFTCPCCGRTVLLKMSIER